MRSSGFPSVATRVQ